MQSLRLSRRWPPPGWASVPAQHHHDVLQVVLDAEQEMVPVGDHGHPRRQVPGHTAGRHPHPSLVKVQGKFFLDNLLAGGDGDLDGSLNNGTDTLLDRLLNGKFFL